ncbi:DUF6461 domain-containing protein [Herbidospora daliensis]|uniref:DUF6461 domain-containing protein n=1 Tax=Herbidospora daliensis TaxID=295585 RepID=UPI000783C484|nr:DUF6461 domain-containing protein [Herbidospora daliensis]
MTMVTPEMIDHYTELSERLKEVNSYICNSMGWIVLRGRDTSLSVEDVVRRLGVDPGLTRVQPLLKNGEGAVAEQVGTDVIVALANVFVPASAMPALSQNAEVWGFWYLVNNTNSLFYAADGHLVTEVDVWSPYPDERVGTDPHALDAVLHELQARSEAEHAGEDAPDCIDMAFATVEALTGARLTAEHFTRPLPWFLPRLT